MPPKYTPDDVARFWSKVDKSGECWIYTGALNWYGYGHFGVGSHSVLRVHRLSYELAFGSIPQGMLVCHTCDNRACVRPDHLFLGTHADNYRDMVQKGRRRSASTLTPAEVQSIRRRYRNGHVTHEELAADFGVNRRTIGRIISRQRRQDVP